MPARRHPIHVPYLVDRLRTVPPKDLADAADADSLNQSFNSIMGELHRYLRYLQDADDAGLPAGAFAGTPTDLEVGATAILGDPELGWIGGGHTHGIPSGSPVGLGAALSDGVLPTFSRSDHVHKYDILGRLAGADIGVHGAINWLDTASIDFTVASDVGNDELEISAVVLAAGIDHGGLAGLGDDDHLQYLLLAGRAGGQTAFGGTAAGNILELQGADNSPDVGRLTINSPITLTYDVASNTTPAEPYVFRWNPTASYGAFIGGFLTIAPDMTATATTFIPATFSDNSIIRHAANPAFAAFTFINELATIQNSGNFNLMQGLVINVGMVHARITSGTSTTPQTVGMNFAPQTRASISGAVMTRTTGLTAINVAPTFSTVSGATVNLGTIRGMLFAEPAVALFQPGTGVENMTAYYGIDFPNMTFGGAAATYSVIRSQLNSGTNKRFLDHTGNAISRLRGHLFFDVDAFGVVLGAAGDVLLRWQAAGYFSTYFNSTLTDLRLSSPAANRFLWDSAGGGTTGEFNFNCAKFSLGGQTGAVGNQVGVFVAPTRATGLAGGWSDFLLTQAGNITVNHAMSQLFGWTINAPSITLGTGSVTDAGALLVGGNVSNATNRYGLLVLSNPSGGTENWGGRFLGPLRTDRLLQFDEALNANTTTAVATPHAAGDEHVILVDDDTVGGAVTVNLPAASGVNGRVYHIKKLGSTGNVTIDANGAETIDGALTQVISVQYTSLMLVCDGTGWWVI